MNKVTYGFDKVHYALYNDNGTDGLIGTYETPKRITGGVGFSPTAQGGSTSFYADNGPYHTITQDNGVQGDLEMALFPDEFLIETLNWVRDDKGILVEKANVSQNPFALLFEVLGNVEPIRVAYLHCLGAKPNDSYITSQENVTIQGKTMNITAKPIQVTQNVATAVIKVKRSEDPEIFDSFFEKVYIPTFDIPEA